MKRFKGFKLLFGLTIFVQSTGILSMSQTVPVQQQKMLSTRIYEKAVVNRKTGYLDKYKAIAQFKIETQRGAQENKKIPTKDNSIFRIMTYNVHFWNNPESTAAPLQEMIDIIKTVNPDVVILQEVSPTPGVGRAGPLKGSLAMQKLDGIGFNFNNIATCNTLPPRYWFGNIIASKVSFNTAREKIFKGQPDSESERRCFVSAQVTMPNKKELYLYGTHLEVRGRDSIRKKQIEEIKDLIVANQTNKNVLVAADFNAVRGTSPVKALQKAGFKDCFTYLGWQHPTYTSWTGKEIDFIFLSPKWNLPLAGCYVYYDAVSDHLPVIMDIKLDARIKKSTPDELLKMASRGILNNDQNIRRKSLEIFRTFFEQDIGFEKANQVVQQASQSSNRKIKSTAKQLEAMLKKYQGSRAGL